MAGIKNIKELQSYSNKMNMIGNTYYLTRRQTLQYVAIGFFSLFFYILPTSIITMPMLLTSFYMTTCNISILFLEGKEPIDRIGDFMVWSIKSAFVIYQLSLFTAYINIPALAYITMASIALAFLAFLPQAVLYLTTISSNHKPTFQICILNLFLAISLAVIGIHFSLVSFHCLNIICRLQTPIILNLLSTPSLHLHAIFSLASAAIMPPTEFESYGETSQDTKELLNLTFAAGNQWIF